MDGSSTTFLLGRPIFRGYVSFREGMNHRLLSGGVAASVGPLLGLFVFLATGNSWTAFSMKVVPLAMDGTVNQRLSDT